MRREGMRNVIFIFNTNGNYSGYHRVFASEQFWASGDFSTVNRL